ncbi:hypothetical protein MtrunA17_Chr4g0007631 [Medicago truncatula]|uniref:DUF674 family protein n=1 Tax=Medicago truncatula TaxID=3880 RepID=A0A072UGZ2_MEDTR|nr:uncharacterized protein LOC25491490 [Medicago truncatula]KEH28932.1 DUF674 family protein [Medicago truncatula]RHN58925.1 hypothetical protein MtrunA17_Chr4g0007631 [Medicago truncatula]
MAASQAREEPKTIPLKTLIDRENNKVVAVEATKDFIDTLFSFLSLPLATIIRLLSNNDQQQESSESSPFLGSIKNLYKTVQTLTPNDVWNNPVYKQMLLNPKNPCESLCMNLFMNIDDTESSSKFFVCDTCNKFTTLQNLDCTCEKPTNKQPKNLDSEGQENNAQNGVFVKENGSLFLVFDDLKIMPCSLMTSVERLKELGYSDLSNLEEVTHNIGKQEMLNLLKYTLTSHEPLTNTILKSSSKNRENPPKEFASAVRARPCTSDVKMDVKLARSKSQKKIIFAEASENFVDFIFTFLAIPLGSVVKLLDGNSFVGCVDNLYKTVETLDSSLCTDSRSVLLNPGLSPQFGCPKQLLNIPDVRPQPPTTRYYGTGKPKLVFSDYNGSHQIVEEKIEGGVISKKKVSIYNRIVLTELDPRSSNKSKEGVMGFVKNATLYAIGDDLTVKPLSGSSCISYLKELSLPLDDLEMKVISIGEAEALSLLAASLTSKFTLTSGLENFFIVPKQESNLTSKYIQSSRLDELAKEPIAEA